MSETGTAVYNRKELMALLTSHSAEHHKHASNARNSLFARCYGDESCMNDHDGDTCAEENDGEDCTCTCECDSREVAVAEAAAFAALAQSAATMAHTIAVLMQYSA